jgi:hypothetical protein
MAETPSAFVDEMLDLVPAAVPGAVSLTRVGGVVSPVYSLRYLSAQDTRPVRPTAARVETVEMPIATSWRVDFVVGVAFLLFGATLGALLPFAAHHRGLALVALAFVSFGVLALWRSRFTFAEPNRASLAAAVISARLASLRLDDDVDAPKLIGRERELSEELVRRTGRAALSGR